ncbi:putative bifunctional diguanylate cyclase/phosphodiesterase [Rhizomonospora bruguierae]|uniref:putative bifunctional diguanylate cyclase/phosphodiesterase n=1 Tax=Rhizomonospora bruguierae TaxID=1581705 RepID=UPI001BCE4D68
MLPHSSAWAAAVTAVTAAAGVTQLLASARRRTGPARLGHRLLAAGSALAGVTAVGGVAVALTLPEGPPSVDSVAAATGVSAGIVIAVLLLLAGVLSLPGIGGTPGLILRHGLDAVVAAAAVWYVGWALLKVHVFPFERGLPPPSAQALLPAALAAFAFGLAVVCAVRCPAPRHWAGLAGAGVALTAAGGGVLASGLCEGRNGLVGGAAVAVGVGLPMVALVSRARDRPAELDANLVRAGTAYAFLPMLAMSVAALYHLMAGGHYDAVGLVAGMLEGLALAGRQFFALRDVRRYAQRLAEREAHFRELAHTDPLTGLANRRGLLRAMYATVGGPPCVLLGLDLDGFKNVNDMRGHDVGDAVLVEVGRRLRASLRPDDVPARLGGDEFAVFMPADPAEARRVAERLLGVLGQPYELGGSSLFLSVSIGLASGASAPDVPTLLRNTDLALRYAKQRGKSRVEPYDVAYDRLLRRRSTIEHELRRAIERGELRLAYQPVVTLPSVRPVGAEALLRWDHPELGAVSPEEFVPIAEETGQIVPIGAWVLRQACHRLSLWLAAGHDVWVSVNVSPRELHAADYVERVTGALRAHRVPPQRLVLEVTEHAVATDLAELVRRLRALRDTGVRIALDDFGAGYSSLGQLRTLPVDILKIDQRLVADVAAGPGGAEAPLVDIGVRLGHKLGLEVIAEGMAEPRHRIAVERAGCRWGQGWLFGGAVPAEHLEARLAASPPPLVPLQRDGSPPASRPAAGPVSPSGAHQVGQVDSGHEMRKS